jgi:hypothetical protein
MQPFSILIKESHMRKPYEQPALTGSSSVVEVTTITGPKGVADMPYKNIAGSVGFGL